jgi:hypothetical protein
VHSSHHCAIERSIHCAFGRFASQFIVAPLMSRALFIVAPSRSRAQLIVAPSRPRSQFQVALLRSCAQVHSRVVKVASSFSSRAIKVACPNSLSRRQAHCHAAIFSAGQQIPLPRHNLFHGPANPIATPPSFPRAGKSHRHAAIFSTGRQTQSFQLASAFHC